MPATDLTALCVQAVEAAGPGEQVEAYASEGRRTQVRVRDGEVESFTSSYTRGVGVRLVSDGRLGYSYAADPDRDGVGSVVDSARESATFTEPDEGNVLPALVPVEDLPGIYRPAQASLERDRRVALALDLERAAVSAHPDVRRVESAVYGDAVGRVVIASTEGGPVESSRTDCWALVLALAERDGEVQTGFDYRRAHEVDELEWTAAARDAAQRGARLLGGRKPATERLPVVLDPVAATSFLGVLSASFSGESVLKGRSLLAGLVGSTVGSAAVTLVDDGRFPLGPALAPFDDEGVATGRTPLVERGVLRQFLHNTGTAVKSAVASTGNADRGSYRTVPGVSPSNLYLGPGDLPVEELLRRADRAVYVQEVTGVHSGANPVSGEFSVGATGLRVEGGGLAGPLREMTIASTLLDLLRGVVAVASDLRFPGGGLGSPTVLVGEMTVGGT